MPGFDLIGSYSHNGFFFDTLSPLYLELKDRCHSFTDDELDHFDHLFFGSHLPMVLWQDKDQILITAHEHAASGNISALRGLWRKQDEVFVDCRKERAHGEKRPLCNQEATLSRLIDAQGLRPGDANRLDSLALVMRADAQGLAMQAASGHLSQTLNVDALRSLTSKIADRDS